MNQPKLLTHSPTQVEWHMLDFNEQLKIIDRELKAAEEWRKTHPEIKFIDYVGILRPQLSRNA